MFESKEELLKNILIEKFEPADGDEITYRASITIYAQCILPKTSFLETSSPKELENFIIRSLKDNVMSAVKTSDE